jgi:hypothetical protein
MVVLPEVRPLVSDDHSELTGAGGTALSRGERPGDTVVRFSHSHPTVRAWV